MLLAMNDWTQRWDRRCADRVALDLCLACQLLAQDVTSGDAQHCQARAIDGCLDGRGLGLRLPLSSRIALGGVIELLLDDGSDHIRGIVVSRMGLRSYFRVGMRVHPVCQSQMRALVEAHQLPVSRHSSSP